jgi:hypothetical protein
MGFCIDNFNVQILSFYDNEQSGTVKKKAHNWIFSYFWFDIALMRTHMHASKVDKTFSWWIPAEVWHENALANEKVAGLNNNVKYT